MWRCEVTSTLIIPGPSARAVDLNALLSLVNRADYDCAVLMQGREPTFPPSATRSMGSPGAVRYGELICVTCMLAHLASEMRKPYA